MTPEQILEKLDTQVVLASTFQGAAELIRKLQTQVKDLESVLDRYGITKGIDGTRSPEWL